MGVLRKPDAGCKVQLQEFQACAADKELCPTENTRETKFPCPNYATHILFFNFCLAFKESKTLLEYKPCILYHFPLGMVFQCSSSEQPLPPPLVPPPSSLLSPWERRTRPEVGWLRGELTFQSFHRLCFTFHFQKEESSNLGGTVGLNAPDQGIWIGLGCDGLSAKVTESWNWLECEWGGVDSGRSHLLADAPSAGAEGRDDGLFPRHGDSTGKLCLCSHPASGNILGKLVCLRMLHCTTSMTVWPEVERRGRMFTPVIPTLKQLGDNETHKKREWSWLFSF